MRLSRTAKCRKVQPLGATYSIRGLGDACHPRDLLFRSITMALGLWQTWHIRVVLMALLHELQSYEQSSLHSRPQARS